MTSTGAALVAISPQTPDGSEAMTRVDDLGFDVADPGSDGTAALAFPTVLVPGAQRRATFAGVRADRTERTERTEVEVVLGVIEAGS